MPLRILHYADVERATDDPERIGRLVGLVRERRDAETLVVGAGDNLAPGVLSLVTKGRQALDLFRAVESDAETFGNHDFDHGPAATRDVVADSPMPWVCANVYDDDHLFAADEGVVPWTVVEADDHRVGVTGVACPETPAMNPSAAVLDFTDPVAAVSDAATALRERDVDHVVVLSHIGDDRELAESTDVDVILGGHAHEEYVDHVEGTLLVRPGAVASGLSEVVFEDRPGAYRLPVGDGPVAEDVVEALRSRQDEAGLTDVVAHVEDPVTVTRRDTKQGESRVGNLVTDAYRWVADADVGLHSTGGIRTCDSLSGDVTAADLVGLCPFENDLVGVSLTGRELRETVRQAALVQYGDEVPTHYFGHLSGLSVVWDDEVAEAREILVDGDPLSHDRTYSLATSEYYVRSTHLFDAFGPGDVVDRFGPQYDAIVAYAREFGVDPSIEGRIRRPSLGDGSD
ncbi:bifunctional metallophosphatase/5'-nucleotidase [Haloarchaeobius sp. HRN-SO-5]|uniref:bifunctional metallophosphatase/5'-nucleotidase n=1 Tax=Haloarchaeobius sp. HRN-SO-5 TaxID=3446118 RepID=UPI003EBB6FB3